MGLEGRRRGRQLEHTNRSAGVTYGNLQNLLFFVNEGFILPIVKFSSSSEQVTNQGTSPSQNEHG